MRREKAEKYEKREKEEKAEKAEKYEKREFGYVGPLIGGIILIFLGVMFYLATIGRIYARDLGPIFLIVVGIIILVVGIYAALTAVKRSPKPP